MLDAEIYVDRIADMRITNMNAAMEAVRQSVIKKKGNDQEDLYLRTLELAQVQEDEYFGHVVSKDLTGILRDIRDMTVYTGTSWLPMAVKRAVKSEFSSILLPVVFPASRSHMDIITYFRIYCIIFLLKGAEGHHLTRRLPHSLRGLPPWRCHTLAAQ